jgi:hypothetical protein
MGGVVEGETYQFTVPDEVQFESRGGGIEHYTFRWGEAPDMALLMLHANPAPMTPRAIKPMADMMEITFEDQLAAEGRTEQINKERTEISFGPFEGVQLEFVIETAGDRTVRQYMFIVHDGSRAWNGQLTALNERDIEKAHAIMESATPIVEEPEPVEKAPAE